METYFIQKRGVYFHGVFGIYFDKDEAISNCRELANNDTDDYHTWQVFKCESGHRYSGKYDGFEEIIFETRKL